MKESDADVNDWSRIVQVSPSSDDSSDPHDVHYLTKTSLVDKLIDNKKEEFKLSNLKVKKSGCVLTSEENLKLITILVK